MNKSLTRSIGFWLLIFFSIASGAVGGWLLTTQLTTMTETLVAGTATGVEVYVGQSMVVLGSTLVGAGVIGILLALALLAVRALLPAPAAVVVEPIDWTAEAADQADSTDTTTTADEATESADVDEYADDFRDDAKVAAP